ncbi:MAG: DUF3393 domain-containing protein [Epsilonproteobacteria bacterium]|nr:DUF3393 domain-containing protein [Campylobacterota bacterium]OIO13707.1 MAG: murein transglycosylase [Helicobacteraceae bacterium CG1_02_36_14]PIP10642.1 MAG: murein transglycosylase [Sulfurimonas sp. CG23_combo_of_CG06-09_8_20_14_all_36_33]PIS25615.1 MAG: DUF3393 domain-containing protein [Sulfurimonas sp. CG08_land_8_20_14_0_20_36_33]PIU34922.1 MAG: DUF3393 domain-containing protein [Sulfurimonas sp. CG07_land_8_20_14_0_80_36_56]PIV04635.1 MAG: DUF3393 domain-containing protein [Sulfurim
MFTKTLLVSAISTLIFAQTAQEFNQQQMQGFGEQKKDFARYKKSQEEEFASYQEAQMQTLNKYKKEIGALWDEPKISTKKAWVAYTPDKKTRTDVDFGNEIITVETIASSQEEAKNRLQIALAKVISIDTKSVQETDPLEKELAKIKKPVGVIDSEIKSEPILSNVVFKNPPTKESVRSYVNKNVSDSTIKQQSSKIKDTKIYKISVKMPQDAMLQRSKVYYDEVKKQAKRQSLPIPLLFSIMHSESSFNPRARSYVPAFGLMQIVPKTAGIDTYQYLYKEKKLVTGSYLYNSTNNITMGAAYLHILYYKYLKDIKDPDSRLYCTIAAYNTGAGNIAWAFTKKYNMTKAAPLINRLSSDEVYKRLLKDLRFEEPKHYLKNVTQRMSTYHKVYGS